MTEDWLYETLLNRACEVCGTPATALVQDAKEEAPVEMDGKLWSTWAMDGPPHLFCDAHQRPHRETPLPGPVDPRRAGDVLFYKTAAQAFAKAEARKK